MAGPVERNYVGPEALLVGDTIDLLITGVTFTGGRTLLTAGIELRSTIKRYIDNPDPGLAQVDNLALGGIDVVDGSTLRLVYPAAVARLFPECRAKYDVVADFSYEDGEVLQFGEMQFAGDITRPQP